MRENHFSDEQIAFALRQAEREYQCRIASTYCSRLRHHPSGTWLPIPGMSPIIEYQLPCQPAGLLRAASDDVMGGSFDPFLAVGQPAKGLDQFRLACLFGVIIQQL